MTVEAVITCEPTWPDRGVGPEWPGVGQSRHVIQVLSLLSNDANERLKWKIKPPREDIRPTVVALLGSDQLIVSVFLELATVAITAIAEHSHPPQSCGSS